MSDTYVQPAYGWAVYRSLHSRMLDLLIDGAPEVREPLFVHLNGEVTFVHFLLHVHETGRLRITTRIDGEDAYVGLAVPTGRASTALLFEMHHKVLGISPDTVLAANLASVERDLERVLGGLE